MVARAPVRACNAHYCSGCSAARAQPTPLVEIDAFCTVGGSIIQFRRIFRVEEDNFQQPRWNGKTRDIHVSYGVEILTDDYYRQERRQITHGAILQFFAPTWRHVPPIVAKFGTSKETNNALRHAKFQVDRSICGDFWPKKRQKSRILQTYLPRRGESLNRYLWNL